jgi:mannitol/fructose-specific phosphotransferase system IIA component (Ntr-type)
VTVLLSQHLKPDSVLIAPQVRQRDELFALFAALFSRCGLTADSGEIVKRLIEREAILSTGIGSGVAVPHAQISGLGCLAIAASIHPDGIEYPSLDDKPVRLVFCLIGDTNTAADHLAGLARLARLARKGDKLEALINARSGEEFIASLSRLEED